MTSWRRSAVLILAGALACAALAACQTGPPRERLRTVTVNVPTPVPCVVDPGPAPAYPDTDAALAAAPDVFVGVQILMAGRALRIARESQWEAASAGCRGPPAARPP